MATEDKKARAAELQAAVAFARERFNAVQGAYGVETAQPTGAAAGWLAMGAARPSLGVPVVGGWFGHARVAGAASAVQMMNEDDRHFAELLRRVVRRSSEMQKEGRLEDRASRAEMEFLEDQLRATRARLTIGVVPAAGSSHRRAQRLTTLAQELCEASRANCQASLEVQQESRRIRKRLYLCRLIRGSVASSTDRRRRTIS